MAPSSRVPLLLHPDTSSMTFPTCTFFIFLNHSAGWLTGMVSQDLYIQRARDFRTIAGGCIDTKVTWYRGTH